MLLMPAADAGKRRLMCLILAWVPLPVPTAHNAVLTPLVYDSPFVCASVNMGGSRSLGVTHPRPLTSKHSHAALFIEQPKWPYKWTVSYLDELDEVSPPASCLGSFVNCLLNISAEKEQRIHGNQLRFNV